MRRRAAIIVNPTSGRNFALDKARHAAGLLAETGLVVSLHKTERQGHGRELAEGLCAEADVLVSVGGDGTLNEVINGVLEARASTPIALLPAGTANVVARELHLPESFEQQVLLAAESEVRSLDLGRANERLFAMCAGIGFDAQIVQIIQRERSDHGLTMIDYYLPTLQTAMEYRFHPMRVTVDGACAEEASTFTLVANMKRYGGPFRFFNTARPDDGVLDVCCLHGKTPLDLIRYGWGAFWKQLPKFRDVTHHTGRHITVEADEVVLVQIDGEIGGKLPMTFRILPQAVNFCVS